jgi:hypothetical protein
MTSPLRSLRIENAWDGTPLPPEHWITLHILESGSGIELRVQAPLYGDPPPPASPPGPTDKLWEHEVVELFILGPNGHYTEIELSPSGHHLVLKLDGVRKPVETCLPMAFEARCEGARWSGRANLDAAYLPPKPWRINATAIHGSGDERRYLSWVALPGDEPDFHQLAYFRSVV